MELTYSAVDNFDIPMLVRALRIPGGALRLVEDLQSRRRLVHPAWLLHGRQLIPLRLLGVDL